MFLKKFIHNMRIVCALLLFLSPVFAFADNNVKVSVGKDSKGKSTYKYIAYGLGRVILTLPDTMEAKESSAKDINVPMVPAGFINNMHALVPITDENTPNWIKDRIFLCDLNEDGYFSWDRLIQNTIKLDNLSDRLWLLPKLDDKDNERPAGLSLVTYRNNDDGKTYLILSSWSNKLRLYSMETEVDESRATKTYSASYVKTIDLGNFSASKLDIIDLTSMGRSMSPHLVVWGRTWNKGGYSDWNDESEAWSTGLQLFKINTNKGELTKSTDFAYWDFPVSKNEHPTLSPLKQLKFDKKTYPLGYGMYTGDSWTGIDEAGKLSLYFTHHKGNIISNSTGYGPIYWIQMFEHKAKVYHLKIKYTDNGDMLELVGETSNSQSGGKSNAKPYLGGYSDYTVQGINNDSNGKSLRKALRNVLGANSYAYKIKPEGEKLYYLTEKPTLKDLDGTDIPKNKFSESRHGSAGKIIAYNDEGQFAIDESDTKIQDEKPVTPGTNGTMEDVKNYLSNLDTDVQMILWGFGYAVSQGNKDSIKDVGLNMSLKDVKYHLASDNQGISQSSEEGIAAKGGFLSNLNLGFKNTYDNSYSESNSTSKTIDLGYSYKPSDGLTKEEISNLGVVGYRYRYPWLGYVGELKGTNGESVTIENQPNDALPMHILSIGATVAPLGKNINYQNFSLSDPAKTIGTGWDKVADYSNGPSPLSDGMTPNHPGIELKVEENKSLAVLVDDIKAWQKTQPMLAQLVNDIDTYKQWKSTPNPHGSTGVKSLISEDAAYVSYNLKETTTLKIGYENVNEMNWSNAYGYGFVWDLKFMFGNEKVFQAGPYSKGSVTSKHGDSTTVKSTKSTDGTITFGGNSSASNDHNIRFYIVSIDVLAFKGRPNKPSRPNWMPKWCWERNDNYVFMFSWVPENG
jgi:hypothetical protein